MSDSTSLLTQLTTGQAGKEATVNELFNSVSQSALFGRRQSSSGLAWDYFGGRIRVAGVSTAIANGSVTLTASATNYIEATKAGVVSKNTTGFTNGSIPLYKVVTGTATVTSYEDHRGYGMTEKIMAGLIVGNPGSEGTGINIGGVTYESTFKCSDINGVNYAQTILHRHSTTLEPLIVGARSNSNDDSHIDVTAGLGLFTIYAAGWAGSNYKLFGAWSFAADDTGTISNTSAPGKWTLFLTPDGSTTLAAVIVARNDKSVSFSGKFGYESGAGGTVSQATSKSTGVTLNKLSGAITMDAATLNAGTAVGFTLTNSTIAAADLVLVNIKSGATADSYNVDVDAVAAGSCRISIRNHTAGNLSEAVVLSFAVIKGVAA